MFCPNCGSEITSNNNFCPNCGTNLSKINTKNNKKIIITAIFIAVILLLIVLCATLGRKIMAERYYNKGYNAYLNWMEYTNNGRNLGGLDELEKIEEILSDIDSNFNKCLNIAGDHVNKYNINYEFAKNCYSVLSAYVDLKDTRVSYYDKEVWEDYFNNLNDVYTGNEQLDNLTEIVKSECKSALFFYSFDYQGAYDEIKWCEDYLEYFITDLYYISFGVKNLVSCEYFSYIQDKQMTVNKYELMTYGGSDNKFNISKEYPLIEAVFYYDNSEYHYYWNYENGSYTMNGAASLQTENDLIVQNRTYSYIPEGLDKKMIDSYIFDSDFIEGICSQSIENKIIFLNEVPDCIEEADN